MESPRDFSVIFKKMLEDFSTEDMEIIAEISAQCDLVDPDIQEILNYVECINQPFPSICTGI